MTVEYTLRVIKASNGWVVHSYDPYNTGGMPVDTMVVQDDKDLAGVIAAALVSQKLEGVGKERPKKPTTGKIFRGEPPHF